MARTIGSVEIIVVGNTKRLVVQATEAGKESGTAIRKEIESEIKKVKGRISQIDGEKAAQLVRARIEEAVRDLGATLDFTEAREQLKVFEEQVEAVDLVLNTKVDLSEEDIQRIRTDFAGFKEELEADKIRAQLELDFEDAVSDALDAEATLERLGISWRVNLDGVDEALAEADAAKGEMEADKIRFQVGMAESLAEAMLEASNAKLAMEKDDIQFHIDLATALAKGESELTVFLNKRRLLDLGLDLQTATALAELAVFEAEVEGRTIEARVETNLQMAKIVADLEALNALIENYDFDANVKVRVDKASEAAAIAQVSAAGKKAGDGFGKNLISGDNTKLMILAGLSMGDALASGISGGIAAATSIISSGFRALAGGAGAAAPIVAGLAASLGAVVIGSKGVSDSFKAISKEFAAAAKEGRAVNLEAKGVREELQNLAPSARRTAEAFAGIQDELTSMRLGVQEQLFHGFSGVLTDLGRTVLPDVGKGLEEAAGAANTFGKQLADVAKHTNFEQLGKNLRPALDDAFDAATALADTLEPFLRTAAKPAERLAEMLERGAEALNNWVSLNPQGITDFLDDGVTSLGRWMELIGSTADLLGTLFSSGAESGDNFVIGLNNIIERWDAWMESTAGQDSLTKFFATGHEAMQALVPVLDGLKEAFKILITPDTMSNFSSLAQAIGDALPALAELITLIGKLQLAAGFANLLAALGPVLDLIGKLPAGMLEMAGTAIVVSLALVKLGGALKAVSAAAKLLALTNPELLLLVGAITAVVVAYDALQGKSKEAEARTRELTSALNDNIDAMLSSGDAIDAARLGIDALNKTLTTTGKGSEKINDSFALINSGAGDMTLGVDDATSTLTGLKKEGDGSIPTLKKLAEGWGLSGEAADIMAEAVAGTDRNMDSASATGTHLGHTMTELANKTGIPRKELVKLFGALEELQDQAENTDLEVMQQAFLDTVSTGTEAEQAVLATAEAMQKSGEIAAGTGPLYEKVVELLGLSAIAADDATASNIGAASSYQAIDDAIRDGLAAVEDRNAALKEERDKAYDAWQQEQLLAEKTEDAAVAAADAIGFGGPLAQMFVDVGNAAEVAAGQADAFLDVMDIILGPGFDVKKTSCEWEKGIDDIAEALTGGKDAANKRKEADEELKKASDDAAEAQAHRAAGEEDAAKASDKSAQKHRDAAQAAVDEADALEVAAKTLDDTTPIGRDNNDMLEDHTKALLDSAAAQLRQGEAANVVNDRMKWGREILIQEAEAFLGSREAAEGYVTALLGTPDLIETVVTMPGVADALLHASDLTLLYDAAGKPVVTEFTAQGLDPALATSQEFKALLEKLGLIEVTPTVDTEQIDAANTGMTDLSTATATPEITLTGTPGTATIDDYVVGLTTIDEATAEPEITVPKTAEELLDALLTKVDTLDDAVASPTITIPFVDTNITKMEKLDGLIRNLPNKTVTVTVNTATAGGGGDFFGIQPPGGMAGAMINGPRLMRVGERGYREALVPLDLPLNRIDPDVRMLAAMLRGETTTSTLQPIGPRTVVNQRFELSSADPRAVATQVMNRAVAMATR